ncbi:hypothetical protein [Riemerella anatipestifer]|uniref:hypothetical protein n=1 Tax=Riemerella anatipestifer TaxID=34085 RepID=UPI0007EC4D08|nr:hypothetical protein [Riemerella anatipestifer]AZZ58223.1 hypothetical protein AWB57_03745 [Riemerella anatipestifer]MCW0511385.1 hypothetical protein [Riemerella anatipestifer]MCW0519860.1 hypothetical protein [Riemerella anatipestifer]MDY3391130.1 hypothetical protein [Riemerella anatipestifer]MDY3519117.1 hypothetical protein [Riemerella anatipestifer]
MTAIAVNLMSCNRSENDETVTESIPVLPTKIHSTSEDGDDSTITFIYNGNKLLEIVGAYGSDTNTINFEYSNNLISKIVEKKNVDITTTTFEYLNGRLIKTVSTGTEDNKQYNLKEVTNYTYNNDDTVTVDRAKVSTYPNGGIYYTSNISYIYTLSNGQIYKYTIVYDPNYTANIFINTVSYDDKNGVFRNIVGFKEALLGLINFMGNELSFTQNNYTTHITDNNGNFYKGIYQNTYNTNNYPIKMITTITSSNKSGSHSSTYTITYNK